MVVIYNPNDYLISSINKNLFHRISNELSWDDKNIQFQDVTGEELNDLIFSGAFDVRENMSTYYSPHIESLALFLNDHPSFTTHGYIKYNGDSIVVCFDGLYCGYGFSNNDKTEFLSFSASSDVLRCTDFYLYSRWG